MLSSHFLSQVNPVITTIIVASQNAKIKMDHGDLRKTESAWPFEPINIKILSKQRTVHLTLYQQACEGFFPAWLPPWQPCLLCFSFHGEIRSLVVEWCSGLKMVPRAWTRGIRLLSGLPPTAILMACSDALAEQAHPAISNSFLLVDVGSRPREAGIKSIFLLLCHRR